MSKKYILYCLGFFMIFASKTFSNETTHPDTQRKSQTEEATSESKFGVPSQVSNSSQQQSEFIEITDPVSQLSESGESDSLSLTSVGENDSANVENRSENPEDETEIGSDLITEDRLKEIIEQAKNAPLPEEGVEMKNREPIFTKKNSFKTNVEIVDEFKDTLDKYNFSNKSNDVHVGHINANEFTSDQLINNSEVGVGISYKEQNERYRNRSTSEEDWNYTPIYATGKYKISEGENNTKYLKVNLGYSFKEVSKEERKDSDDRVQGGIYYGIGGGVDYHDMSVGVMYQVNKDSKEDRNTHKDDSRVTFSVDYKLGM